MLILTLALAQAEPDWHQLRSAAAEASSHLKSNWNRYEENYHPNYVLDEDPATAWVEGRAGDGVGEKLILPVSVVPSARAVKLQIRNGYQKSSKLMTANNAPKDVRITVRGARGEVSGTMDVRLELREGWQDVVIPLVAPGSVRAVEIELRSVYFGRLYQDACISDVLVFVDSDVAYAPQAEAARLAELRRWISSRAAEAKALGAVDATYPYAATNWSYVDVEVVPTEAEAVALFAPFRERVHKAQGGDGWYRVAPIRTYPVPDGLPVRHWATWLRSADVGLFETPEEEGWHVIEEHKAPDEGEGVEWTVSTTHVMRVGPAEAPEAVYFKVREVESSRISSTSIANVLVSYGPGGLVTTVYEWGRVDGDFYEGPRESLYQLTWNDQRQLVRVEMTRLEHLSEDGGPQQVSVSRVAWVPG